MRDSNPRILLRMYGLANRCITTLPIFQKKNLGLVSQDFGGKSRIRTHGTLAGTSDFKSDAIDQLCHFSVFFVPPTGFEPVTYGLENRCSIRLSYKGMFYNYKIKPFLRNIYNLNQNFLLKFLPF